MPTVLRGKEQYYKCALAVLADEGHKSLNIGRLVNTLGVTSGSFYHHFGSWDGFVEALLDYAESLQINVLRQQNFGSEGADVDVDTLKSLTASLNHRAEGALRAWSLTDDAVRRGMHRMDQRRYKTVRNVVREVVVDAKKAQLLTDLGMAMLIGYQQMVITGNVTGADLLFDEYVKLIFSYRRSRRAKR